MQMTSPMSWCPMKTIPKHTQLCSLLQMCLFEMKSIGQLAWS